MSNQTPFQRMVRTMMAVLVTQAMEDLAVECGYESFYEPAADDHCPAVTISPMRSESQ